MTETQPAEWEQKVKEVSAEFAERLDMLEESGQVSALARWMTENALARVSEELALSLTEDNAAQFTTHIAMAFSRLQRGEAEAEASDALAEEVAAHPREREIVRRIMAECEPLLERKVPTAEVDYMTVHLCALLEDQ